MKKLIFIGLLLVLLIAGGGAAAWYFLFQEELGETAEAMLAPLTEEEPELMEIPALSIPVIRDGALQKYVLINVSLELDGPESRVFVYSRMDKLEDAFFRDLHGYFGSVADTSKVNLRLLTARLYREAVRVLGDETVEKVHIIGAYERTR